ncbi:hypothetical protein FSP39_013961 [Pinctada imbricata]|uniref:Cytochrome P450 n=1 Tax=Pinctada imbricata TaxID=66713 RepID=A0AA89BZD9_PINIB|nr:hypothetical protein FSP39_013961 [Pinctada imbricata]
MGKNEIIFIKSHFFINDKRIFENLFQIPYSAGTIPEPSLLTHALLRLKFGSNKLSKLEYLTDYYNKEGLFKYDAKIYIVDPKLAQTAINKLEKGAENYLEDSPLKDTFLGSSQKSPETRRAIAAIFRKTSIEEKSNMMIKDIDLMCEKMKVETKGHVNITEWTLRLALDIVGHVLLQLDFRGLDGHQEKLLECMMTMLHRCYALREITSDSKEFQNANDEFDKITIQVLEDALNKDDDPHEGKRLVKSLHEACGFDEAKDNMKLFLMAGTETTASTIPVVFSLLTQYPEVQDELRDEADSLIGRLRSDPTIPLPKIDAMMKEVLRLYPIAPFISRQNQHPVSLGPISLEKHADILIFTWGIHRSEYLWKRSKEFVPDRFRDPSSKDQSNFYIPFGAGSRVCIGQHLAWLELRLAIAILLNKFEFHKGEETPDLNFVVDYHHAVVHPDVDMKFVLKER